MSDFLFAPTPHKEAVEFIAGKTIVSREVFAELLPELRARAFTIAGVTSFDVLQRVREELATLPAGGDWNQIKKSVVEEIHPFLADPEDPENTDAAERRAETLLKTHGFQAYSAASYKVMDRQRAVFPFWQYHSMGDGHVRPTHGALNGIVLPANSPFWKGHFPPWEWGCRCQVIPLMQEEVDAMKEKEADQPVEKREVIEGVPLRQLEDHHRLTRGPDQVWDVRTPAEKGDHKGLRWNPDDLRITPQMLEGRYDPVVWATFERWARATPIHEKESLTVWEWMGGKKLPEEAVSKHNIYGKNPEISENTNHGHYASEDHQGHLQEGMQNSPATLPGPPTASDLDSRAEDIATSAKQPLRALSPDRPRDYLLESSIAEIDREDSDLIGWAKKNNRFIAPAEVLKFQSNPALENVGNKEHDVWKVETSSGAYMIRRTKNGTYGLKFRSPFQYLQRMADVDDLVPKAPIRFLGVSQNNQGAGVIWTVQPYIEGRHPTDKELASWLKKHGWIQKDDRTHRYYQYRDTGIKIHDLHAGNCIKTTSGDIIPIDVFFEGIQ